MCTTIFFIYHYILIDEFAFGCGWGCVIQRKYAMKDEIKQAFLYIYWAVFQQEFSADEDPTVKQYTVTICRLQ